MMMRCLLGSICSVPVCVPAHAGVRPVHLRSDVRDCLPRPPRLLYRHRLLDELLHMLSRREVSSM
jgi:hypothetical protein